MSSQPQPTTSKPRIALACDWLTTPGGAEKLLLELHRLYPDAPIYTSQYSKKGINWFNDADVRTGWLQIFPKSFRKILGPLRQIYFSHLDLSDYDLVISVTGAEAKAIKTFKTVKNLKNTDKSTETPNNLANPPKKNALSPHYSTDDDKSQYHKAFHLCYCHVPTQYYWQMYDKYVENPGFGLLNPLVRLMFKLLVKPLRQADFKSAQRPDQFIAISHYSAALIKQYYHRDAVIIAPPVDVKAFSRQSELSTPNNRPSNQDLSTKTMNLSTAKSQLIHQDPSHYPQETYILPQVIHQKSTENPHLSTAKAELSTKEPHLSTDYPQDSTDFSTAENDLSTTFPQGNEELSTGFPQNTTNLFTESNNFSTTFPQEQAGFSTNVQDFSTGNQKFSTVDTSETSDTSETVNIPKSGKDPETRQTSKAGQLTASSESPETSQIDAKSNPKSSPTSEYYIIACRQVTWKRVDLAIVACRELSLPLKVVGDGPEHHRLIQLAADAPNIEFVPWVETRELAELLRRAKAYIFPSLEPFGIAAVEALATGCPVIAYREGGSQDFVNAKNGVLFDEQTSDSLIRALRQFETRTFRPDQVAQTATKFGINHFRSAIENLVAKTLRKEPILESKDANLKSTNPTLQKSAPSPKKTNPIHNNSTPSSEKAKSKSTTSNPKEPSPNRKKAKPKPTTATSDKTIPNPESSELNPSNSTPNSDYAESSSTNSTTTNPNPHQSKSHQTNTQKGN